jgi:hypothetical protein
VRCNLSRKIAHGDVSEKGIDGGMIGLFARGNLDAVAKLHLDDCRMQTSANGTL